MIYTITDNIYFDDDKKVIFSDEFKEELSITVANLLVIFLENSNQLVKREDLLLNVWEKNNLIPSDSNLNKNISLTRKSLASFGIHGVIETVPKQGFIFHSHTEYSKFSTEKVNGELYEIILRFVHQRRMVAFLFVSAIFLFGILSLSNAFKSSSDIGFAYKSILNKCTVYSTRENYNAKLSGHTIFDKIISACKIHPFKVFIDDNHMPKDSFKNEVFVALCRTSGQNVDNSCKNYALI